KGGKTSAGGRGRINQGRKINALEVVALGRVNVETHHIKPFAVLGPSLGITMTAKDDAGKDLKDAFKTADLQIVFGGSVQVANMVAVEARFQHSVYEIYTDS